MNYIVNNFVTENPAENKSSSTVLYGIVKSKYFSNFRSVDLITNKPAPSFAIRVEA